MKISRNMKLLKIFSRTLHQNNEVIFRNIDIILEKFFNKSCMIVTLLYIITLLLTTYGLLSHPIDTGVFFVAYVGCVWFFTFKFTSSILTWMALFSFQSYIE